MIRRGLEDARYQVDHATDGAAGLQHARENRYNLIVLDVMLPRRDGWEVCRELRAERDTTPILMLTARDAVDDRVRGLELGADDYLPKPFDFKEFWPACALCCGATAFIACASSAWATWK
jgi:two-component system copper resistance phosphate regulon response regulator CusR